MPLCHSYSPNYFSLSDILSTEERISCKMEVSFPRLGFLDSSSDTEDLKSGTKLELPVWLAYSLSLAQGTVLSVDIPNIYKDSYREILQADSCAVTLSKWNHFYYELGMHLRRFNNRDSEKITDMLLQTFKTRFRLVMDWAQNPTSDPTLGMQLPKLERDLYHTGKKGKVQLITWLKRGTGNIETSEVAANLKKRKRTDYELDSH